MPRPPDRIPDPEGGLTIRVSVRGTIVVRYADHEETITAGQAYYMAPGHVPEATEAIELLQFSPTTAYQAVDVVMQRNIAALSAQPSA